MDEEKLTATAQHIKTIAEKMATVNFPAGQINAAVFVAEQLVVAKHIAETVFGTSSPRIALLIYDRMSAMFGINLAPSSK